MISKPRVFFVIGTAITLALATVAMVILVACTATTGPHHHHLIACGVPVVAILGTGAFLLARGSRIGRVVLAFAFGVMLLSLAILSAFSVLVLGVPLSTLKIPLAAVILLLAPSYLLLFSRRLGSELHTIRSAQG